MFNKQKEIIKISKILLFYCAKHPPLQAKEGMGFHAGKRFGNTIAEIKRVKGKTYDEIADFMGIGYPMLTLYRKMSTFSNVVMHKVRTLEDWGLNSKHYTDENEPRWLPEPVEPEKSEKQLIGELKKEIRELRQEMEFLPELKKEIEINAQLVKELVGHIAEIIPLIRGDKE